MVKKVWLFAAAAVIVVQSAALAVMWKRLSEELEKPAAPPVTELAPGQYFRNDDPFNGICFEITPDGYIELKGDEEEIRQLSQCINLYPLRTPEEREQEHLDEQVEEDVKRWMSPMHYDIHCFDYANGPYTVIALNYRFIEGEQFPDAGEWVPWTDDGEVPRWRAGHIIDENTFEIGGSYFVRDEYELHRQMLEASSD